MFSLNKSPTFFSKMNTPIPSAIHAPRCEGDLMKDIKELIHWTELVVRGMFYSVHAKTTDRNKSDDILAEKADKITKNDRTK